MLFGHVHRFQQLEDPKSQGISQWLLDNSRREPLEGLSSLHQHLNLPKDALLRYGMLSKDITLYLRPNDLKGMGD